MVYRKKLFYTGIYYYYLCGYIFNLNSSFLNIGKTLQILKDNLKLK